jgi:hypothetical protein
MRSPRKSSLSERDNSILVLPFDNEDNRPPTVFEPDADGAVWIDFVADLGDGFDSTFAVASLLAPDQLKVGELTLPRGQLLVIRGPGCLKGRQSTQYPAIMTGTMA